MKQNKRFFSLITILFFTLLQFLPYLPSSLRGSSYIIQKLEKLSLVKPSELDAAGLSSASATLSNPRLSFIGGVSTSYSAGATLIVISGSGNPDNNTNHLFANDMVGIGSGTVHNPNLQVNSIVDTTTLTLKSGLANAVTNVDKVYATQSGTLAINFYTGSGIPNNGSIRIEVPASSGSISGNANDGIPDSAASGSNGFDFNKMTSANISCPNGFTVGTVTPSTAGPTAHLVTCNWVGGSTLPAGANLTVTIGNTTGKLVNPGPFTSHTQGQADVYSISVYTKTASNGGGSTIEDIIAKASPVEGVLVSANIDETLTLTVAGVSNIATSCNSFSPTGNAVTTTATSVPFGTLASTSQFYVGAQKLSVTTNAPGGYTIKIEENDQMGKDGKVCTGASAGEAANCIKDTQCDSGTCTESTSGEWVGTANKGLGYTLVNVTNTKAAFTYNESGRTFSAKQIADQEVPETKQAIMTNTGPTASDEICTVYKIVVSGTQPAGNYWNTVKYTAISLF